MPPRPGAHRGRVVLADRFLARAVTRDRLPQETVVFIAPPIDVNRRTVGVLGVHRIRRRIASRQRVVGRHRHADELRMTRAPRS